MFLNLSDETWGSSFTSASFPRSDGTSGPINRTYPCSGTAVLLPLRYDSRPAYRAQIMMIGGSGTTEPNLHTPATATCEILDTSTASPRWTHAAPMHHPRVMVDGVLLPDGTVFVTNGSATGKADAGKDPVYQAEIYDPRTNSWRQLCPMTIPRLYHSTALLLPDGRVMTAGTDPCWNPVPFNHAELRVELFSPPYLFHGPRPIINSAPATTNYGSEIEISTPQALQITDVTLIRCGSATHSFNSDQRCIHLQVVNRASNTLQVLMPPTPQVAPPGFYMLFILQNGVPSMASFLHLP